MKVISDADKKAWGEETRTVLNKLGNVLLRLPTGTWARTGLFLSKRTSRFTAVVENMIGEGYFEVRRGTHNSKTTSEYRLTPAGRQLLGQVGSIPSENLYLMLGSYAEADRHRETRRKPTVAECRKCHGRIEATRRRDAQRCLKCDGQKPKGVVANVIDMLSHKPVEVLIKDARMKSAEQRLATLEAAVKRGFAQTDRDAIVIAQLKADVAALKADRMNGAQVTHRVADNTRLIATVEGLLKDLRSGVVQ